MLLFTAHLNQKDMERKVDVVKKVEAREELEEKE